MYFILNIKLINLNISKLIILVYLNFMINIQFINLIIYFLIYNHNFNSNLVKLINLSKLFNNIYKSLLSFILLNIILNQYLYLKYYQFKHFYILSILLFHYEYKINSFNYYNVLISFIKYN